MEITAYALIALSGIKNKWLFLKFKVVLICDYNEAGECCILYRLEDMTHCSVCWGFSLESF